MAVRDNLGSAGASVSLSIDGVDFAGSSTLTTPNSVVNTYKDLPYNTEGSSFVVFKNRIHLLGGIGENQTNHYVYNGFFWKKLTNMQNPLTNGSAIDFNNHLCVCGGSGKSYLFDIWDDTNDMWREVSIASSGSYRIGATVINTSTIELNDELHMFINLQDDKSMHIVFSSTTNAWSTDASYPLTNTHVTVTRILDEIHIFGKTGNSYTVLKDGTYESYPALAESLITSLDCPIMICANNIRHIFWGDDTITHHIYADTCVFNWFIDVDIDVPYTGSKYLTQGEIINDFNGTTFVNIPITPCGYNCRLNDRILPTLPVNMYNTGGKAFYLDGILNVIQNENGWYKYKDNNWNKVTELPGTILNECVATLNGLVYIVATGSDSVRRLYNYYPSDSEWVEIVEVPNSSVNACLFVFTDNKLHYMAGSSHYVLNGSAWETSDIAGVEMTSKTKVIVCNGNIHKLASSATNTHMMYNGTNWVSLEALPCQVTLENAVTVFENEIHILGGPNGSYDHYKCIVNGNRCAYKKLSPLPIKIQAPFVTTNDVDIELIGSANAKTSHYGIMPREWVKSSIGVDVSGGSTFILNGALYVAKGYDIYRKESNDVWRKYSIQKYVNGKLLEESVEIPESFENGAVVVIDNVAHFLGGTGTMQKQHFTWDGKTWSKLSNLPYNFFKGSACAYHGDIHLFGGGETGSNVHYVFHENAWSKLTNISYKFGGGNAVVYRDEIHLLGNLSSLYPKYHYKLVREVVESVSDLPYAFVNGSAFVVDDNLYIAGSSSDSSVVTNMYAWDGSSWEKQSTLPFNFAGGSAISHDGFVDLVGTTMDSENSGSDFCIYTCKRITSLDTSNPTCGLDIFSKYMGITNDGTDYYPSIPVVKENLINPDYLYCKRTQCGPVPVVKIPKIKNLIKWSHVVPYDKGLLFFIKKSASATSAVIDNVLYRYDESGFNYICDTPDLGYQRPLIQKGKLHVFGIMNRYEYSDGVFTKKEVLPYTPCATNAEGALYQLYNGRIHMMGGTTTDTSEKHFVFDGKTWTENLKSISANANVSAAVISNTMYLITGSGQNTKAYRYNGNEFTIVNGVREYDSSALIYIDGFPVVLGSTIALSKPLQTLVMWF